MSSTRATSSSTTIKTLNPELCRFCGFHGNDLFGKKHLSNRNHIIGKIQKRNARQQINAHTRHLGIPFGALIQKLFVSKRVRTHADGYPTKFGSDAALKSRCNFCRANASYFVRIFSRYLLSHPARFTRPLIPRRFVDSRRTKFIASPRVVPRFCAECPLRAWLSSGSGFFPLKRHF